MTEQKALLATIRALIISRPTHTTLCDLIKEYRELEGEGIPFRKLGFSTLEEFLVDSKAFELRNQNGEIHVRAVLKQETAHLVQMISAQRKPKLKKKKRKVGRGGSSVGYRVFQQSPRPQLYRSSSVPAQRSGYGSYVGLRKPEYHVGASQRLFPRRVIPASEMRLPENYTVSSRTGTIPKVSVNLCPPPSEPPSEQETKRVIRMTSNPGAQNLSIQVTVPNRKPIEQQREPSFVSLKPDPVTPEFVLSKNTETPVQDLEAYCRGCNYPTPRYSYTFVNFKGNDRVFQCRVYVNSISYCSYPKPCYSVEAAQREAALIAIGRLIVEEDIKQYPVYREDDVYIAGKLITIIKDFLQGIAESAIPEYFRKEYGLSLPENWRNILYKYDEFTVEEIAGRKFVYTANPTTMTNDSADDTEDSEYEGCEALELPWAQDMWSIEITNAITTTDVYGRIVGREYSKCLEVLLEEIDAEPQVRCENVQAGRIYLAQDTTGWHRVRAEEVDWKRERFECFCIDTGVSEVYSELYECKSNHLKLPHQAICFSLAFLEDFVGNSHVMELLDTICSRTPRNYFQARVLTKQKEFEGSLDTPISVILLNAHHSTLDNNINEHILQKLYSVTRAPQLQRSVLNLVKITHVAPSGDVFCQMKDIELNYIQRLTDKLVSDPVRMQHRQPLRYNDPKIRYLINDRKAGKWYRATPETPVNPEESTHRMFCIDFGFVLDVQEKDIYELEALSQALNNFPALAVKCRLYGLQNITPTIVSRIRGLLSEECECIMKMMVSTSIVPQVNCYKRHDGGTFFCINESIKIEEELERQNDMKLKSGNSLDFPDSDNFSRLRI